MSEEGQGESGPSGQARCAVSVAARTGGLIAGVAALTGAHLCTRVLVGGFVEGEQRGGEYPGYAFIVAMLLAPVVVSFAVAGLGLLAAGLGLERGARRTRAAVLLVVALNGGLGLLLCGLALNADATGASAYLAPGLCGGVLLLWLTSWGTWWGVLGRARPPQRHAPYGE